MQFTNCKIQYNSFMDNESYLYLMKHVIVDQHLAGLFRRCFKFQLINDSCDLCLLICADTFGGSCVVEAYGRSCSEMLHVHC